MEEGHEGRFGGAHIFCSLHLSGGYMDSGFILLVRLYIYACVFYCIYSIFHSISFFFFFKLYRHMRPDVLETGTEEAKDKQKI